MKQEMEGKVIVVGDNVDTDQIYPGRYLALTDPAEIGSHCLAGVDENIAASFPAGGIVVAGRNFGCGSSREHAPIALINMGASAVVAESFARIFFRNAVNLGLPHIYIANSPETAAILTVAGYGISFLPDLFLPENPALAKLALEGTVEVSFGVYYRMGDGNPILKDYLKIMAESLESAGLGKMRQETAV